MVDVWLPLQLYLKKFDAELLFTDTDSLTYEIKSENVYEEFFEETNKRVIGKMKDEFGGVIVDEFVRLKTKMYSIKKLMVKNVIQQKE